MKPIKPPGANLELGRPVDWDEERDGPCDSLHALRGLDTHNNPIIQTAWEPDPEELAALNAGAPLVLTIWGAFHPPVAVSVAAPPAKSS